MQADRVAPFNPVPDQDVVDLAAMRRVVMEACFVTHQTLSADMREPGLAGNDMLDYPTVRQAVMSALIGSGYGGWTWEETLADRPAVRIARHPCGDKCTYVDPDREHLFTKQPDGTYVAIPEAVEAYFDARRRKEP